MNLRTLRYNLSENFNLIRWCLVVITFAFVAVVSVSKYINLSDSMAITFSSLEITYLILNDKVSLVYIYLPLYVLIICGIMYDDHFGSIEIIKCGSRRNWLINKYFTLIIYTIIYFIVLVGVNYNISQQVFPYSSKWSTDFVNVQVFMGQEVINFVNGPLQTIGTAMVGVFLLYLFVGTLSIMLSVWIEKEAYVLLSSLAIGIFVSLYCVYGLELTTQLSMRSFMGQCLILIMLTLISFFVADRIVATKDFNIQKKA